MNVTSDPTVNGGEPTVGGTTITVATVVAKAFAAGMDGAAALATPKLDEAVVEAAVTYCAARGCDRALAYCQGCRLRADADGIHSLDDYLRRFSAVKLSDSGLEIVAAS